MTTTATRSAALLTRTPLRVEPEATLPTAHGEFRIRVFVDPDNGKEHTAIWVGDLTHTRDDDPGVLVRIHSECLTGDAFGSARCDCGPQLQEAMRRIQAEGRGAILYLRQEGRDIGLHAKIQAYHLQDRGADTLDANLMLGLPADARRYDVATHMLDHLGVDRVRLLTNNPLKVGAMCDAGIDVTSREPLLVGLTPDNLAYLATKTERMGHQIAATALAL